MSSIKQLGICGKLKKGRYAMGSAVADFERQVVVKNMLEILATHTNTLEAQLPN